MNKSSHGKLAPAYGWLLIIAALLLIAVLVYTAHADSPYGILKNGGFEDGFRGWGPNDSQIPNDWEPFVIRDPSAPPQYKDSAAFGGFTERLDGGHCLIIWTNWVPFDAGIYQRVSGVTPGTSYVLKLDWAPMQSYNPDKGGKQKGDYLGRVVGIDPTGGTDPNSPNVVWSAELWKEKRASGDTLHVSAQAQGDTITAFLRAKNPQPHGQDQVFFDVASLVKDPSQPEGPPPTDTPLPATNTPVRRAPTKTPIPPTDTPAPPTATPGPTDTPTITPTDTPVPPTSTLTPIPITPTPTRTPKATPTPASWLDSPPPTLTTMLLVLGIGSEGVGLSLGMVLGWMWWSGKRRARRMLSRNHDAPDSGAYQYNEGNVQEDGDYQVQQGYEEDPEYPEKYDEVGDGEEHENYGSWD